MSIYTTLDAICDVFLANTDSIVTYLNLNSISMTGAARAVELFDEKVNSFEYNPKILLDNIEGEMKKGASDLISYIERRFAIYDLLENDLIKGHGYANLVAIVADYYSHGASIKHKIDFDATQQKINAQRIASSKVTGLGFGIISNSLVAHLIYNAQSEAAIKKQTAEAKEYLSTRVVEISMQADERWHMAQMQYFKSHLESKMRDAITFAYADMLARCVAFLGRSNHVNVKLIESFDFERSQAILEKAYSVSSLSHKIIEDAFRWCPYNINVYIKAKQCGIFNDKMQMLAKALQLNITPCKGKLNVEIDRLAEIRKRIHPAKNRLAVDSSYVVGVDVGGAVMSWGFNEPGRSEASNWKDIIAISVGRKYTFGLKRDNTVISTKFFKKYDSDTEPCHNQCEVSGWKDIIAISSFWDHTVGLKSDGSVVAVGDNEDGQCEVSEWRDIVAVDTGCSHTIGLKTDGTVVAIGHNRDNRCEVSGWKEIVAISSGCSHSVGLKADGTVVAAGGNYEGECEVSEWTDIVAISAGFGYTVGLKADGTVVAVGDNTDEQCEVTEWTDIVAICAGTGHTLGVKSDGTIVEAGVMSLSWVVSKWRLFDNIDTIAEEEIAAIKRQEDERIAEEKRKEAERIAVLKKQEEEKTAALKRREEELARQQRRANGLCQHCGGTLKGFFSKKCISCGMRKDY